MLVKAQFGRSCCAFSAPARMLSVVHSCLLQLTLPHAQMIQIDSSVPSGLKSASSSTAHVPGHEVASLIDIRITGRQNCAIIVIAVIVCDTD